MSLEIYILLYSTYKHFFPVWKNVVFTICNIHIWFLRGKVRVTETWYRHSYKHIKKIRPCNQGKKRLFFFLQSIVSFFVYIFFFNCQAYFIWGITFMLETRAMQVNLFFGSECKQFSILTVVIEQPWTGQLEQGRIVLGGRESQESELFFVFVLSDCMWKS